MQSAYKKFQKTAPVHGKRSVPAAVSKGANLAGGHRALDQHNHTAAWSFLHAAVWLLLLLLNGFSRLVERISFQIITSCRTHPRICNYQSVHFALLQLIRHRPAYAK